MPIQERERFLCRGDNGAEHTVVIYQRFTKKIAANGGEYVIPGSIDYRTDQGLEVNPTDDPDVFELVDDWQPIRRLA